MDSKPSNPMPDCETIRDLPDDFWKWSNEMQRGWLWKRCVALQQLSDLAGRSALMLLRKNENREPFGSVFGLSVQLATAQREIARLKDGIETEREFLERDTPFSELTTLVMAYEDYKERAEAAESVNRELRERMYAASQTLCDLDHVDCNCDRCAARSLLAQGEKKH